MSLAYRSCRCLLRMRIYQKLPVVTPSGDPLKSICLRFHVKQDSTKGPKAYRNPRVAHPRPKV
jgi:hypothetical protein